MTEHFMPGFFRHVAILCLFVMLAGCATPKRPVRTDPLLSRSKNSSSVKAGHEYGPAELQAAVISFATTFISVIHSATRDMTELDDSPQARLTAARTRLYASASAADIASGPYPGMDLLDMMVFVSLKRLTWQDYWVPKVLGESGRPMLNALRLMEEDIWELAGRLLNAEDQNEMKRLILEWRRRHPTQRDTNYVRFSEFGELGLKPSIKKLTTPGGLFGAIDKAAEAAKDMALTVDRAMFRMRSMQLSLNAQMELAYLELVFQPEVDGMIRETHDATGLLARYADLAEALPYQMQALSAASIRQILSGVADERNATITQLQDALANIEQTAVAELMQRISNERTEAITQAMQGLESQQKAFLAETANILQANHSELRATLDRTFLLGAGLVAFFFICLTVYRLLTRSNKKQ